MVSNRGRLLGRLGRSSSSSSSSSRPTKNNRDHSGTTATARRRWGWWCPAAAAAATTTRGYFGGGNSDGGPLVRLLLGAHPGVVRRRRCCTTLGRVVCGGRQRSGQHGAVVVTLRSSATATANTTTTSYHRAMAVCVVGRNQPSRIVFVRKSRTLQRRASSSLRRRCHFGILVGLVLLVVLVHLDHHVVRHELSNQSLGGHICCLRRLRLRLAAVAVTKRIGSRIGASRRIGGHCRRSTV
jgi:hypothetical protein